MEGINILNRKVDTEVNNEQEKEDDIAAIAVKDGQDNPTSRYMQETRDETAANNRQDRKHDTRAIKIQDSQDDANVSHIEDRQDMTTTTPNSQDRNSDTPPSNGHFRLGEKDAAEELSSNIDISSYQGQDVFR